MTRFHSFLSDSHSLCSCLRACLLARVFVCLYACFLVHTLCSCLLLVLFACLFVYSVGVVLARRPRPGFMHDWHVCIFVCLLFSVCFEVSVLVF